MQIEISGIKIEVQKKNINNLHLVVVPPDGKVRVSAPMHLSDESITMFVRTKDWLDKKTAGKISFSTKAIRARICFGRNAVCVWTAVFSACRVQLQRKLSYSFRK